MAPFGQLCVGDVMTLDPVVVRVDDTIEVAETLLARYRISGLPVVDEAGQLVGVISRTDLLGSGTGPIHALVRANHGTLRVGELMSSPAVTVPLTSRVTEAARVMRDELIHRVVAIDDDGCPIGVLSASDFVSLVADT